MRLNDVKQELVACLREIQELGGRPVPPLTDELRPLIDLPGFDSHAAEAVLAQLEARLGLPQIPHHAEIFGAGDHICTIAEAAERLYRLLDGRGA